MHLVCTNCGAIISATGDAFIATACCGNKMCYNSGTWAFSSLAFKECATPAEAKRLSSAIKDQLKSITGNPLTEPAETISLMYRRYCDGVYESRGINKRLEMQWMKLFAIIPPTVGSIVVIEDGKRIDKIVYDHDKITLWVTDDARFD